ncbi:hypothetical protein CMV_024573, partial [Castanea mollissima]
MQSSKGKLGCGWRGFSCHLRKAIAPESTAFNQPPKFLPGSDFLASKSKSFAAAVEQGCCNEPLTFRQVVAAKSQDPLGAANPSHLMLDPRKSNFANLNSQTQDSRGICLGKVDSPVRKIFSAGSDDGMSLEVSFKLVRGPSDPPSGCPLLASPSPPPFFVGAPLSSSATSETGCAKPVGARSLSRMEPTCTEKSFSVHDIFEAAVSESHSSDASVEVSLCSDNDVGVSMCSDNDVGVSLCSDNDLDGSLCSDNDLDG